MGEEPCLWRKHQKIPKSMFSPDALENDTKIVEKSVQIATSPRDVQSVQMVAKVRSLDSCWKVIPPAYPVKNIVGLLKNYTHLSMVSSDKAQIYDWNRWTVPHSLWNLAMGDLDIVRPYCR